MNSPQAATQRESSLDAVRGIAASVVVVHHCLMTLPVWSGLMLHGVHQSALTFLLGYPPFNLLWAGDAAVRVFFALSGFVLALMFFRASKPGYAAFVAQRICRIYIPYIVVVMLAMLLMTITAPMGRAHLSEWFNASWNRGVTAALLVDHVLMLGQPHLNYVDNPIWSLVHEMRYSIVFPLIVWIVLRVRWWLAGAGSLLLSVAAMGSMEHVSRNAVADSLQYVFLFVAGAVLACHRRQAVAWFEALPGFVRVSFAVASLFLLGARCFSHSGYFLLRAGSSVAPHIGAVMLLISIVGSGRARRWLSHARLLWVGRISYSLYLSHVLVLLTLVSVLHSVVPAGAILLAVPVTAFALAHFLYRWVELPAISAGRSLSRRIEEAGSKKTGRRTCAAAGARLRDAFGGG